MLLECRLHRKETIRFLFLLVMMVGIWQLSVQAAEGMDFFPQRQTIRVGFYQMSGYHAIAPDGHRYGYGYDYLHLIGRYTDWQYEYIGYDKGWHDMFAMLDAGEIDLITAAQKTPEREAKYIFSEKPMAYSSMMMTTLEDNTKYHPGSPAT